MISRFFEGTKPINYLILFIFFLVFFVIKFSIESLAPLFEQKASTIIINFIALVFQIYLVNEIARKANLTELSSFPMLFFFLLITAFSEVLLSLEIVLANFFVILAFQDLLTIDITKRINLNFFNATLWVCVASIFYPLCVCFFIAIAFAIIFYGSGNIRNWLMPIAGIVGFSLVGYAISIVIDRTDFFVGHYRFYFPNTILSEFNFDNYTRLSLYAIANIVLLLIVFSRLQDVGKGRALELRMMLLFFITGIFLTMITLSPEGGLKAILFTFCPVSIYITNYFQIFKRKRLREYMLLFLIIAPISIGIWKLFG